MSSGPVLPGESVLLGVVGPVPFSLNVHGVSSHPGEVGVSDRLGDLVLFAPGLDGGEFTTTIGTSGSSFGPGLLGSKELVVEVVGAVRSGGSSRLGGLLGLAQEFLLGVAERVTELEVSLDIEVSGTTVLVSDGVGHVSHPVTVEEGSLVSEQFVRPDPFAVLLEVVVTDPGISSLNALHGSVHEFVLIHVSSGSELTTGSTAVVSSGVPVERFLG